MPYPDPPRDKPAIQPGKASRQLRLDPQRAKPAIRQPDLTGDGQAPAGRRRAATKPRELRQPSDG